MKPRILVLFCGGTIIMEKDEDGSLNCPSKEEALRSIQRLEPRLNEWAEVGVEFVANVDSTEMTPNQWDQLAMMIYDYYDQYDGFVITHGTDTMAYTASALTFSLRNLGKPVVLTGSQIPGHYLESDARKNFVNAMKVAMMDIASVLIVFADQIIVGVRASKLTHLELRAFSSINVQSLGWIGSEIHIQTQYRKRHQAQLQLQTGFESNIVVLSLVPGMPTKLLDNVLDCKPSGVVLIAYGSGNVPSDYISFLQLAKERKVPVLIRSQCPEGMTKMSAYLCGKEALKYNVIEAYDMSVEAMISKFMWALKRKVAYKDIKSIMHENYAGEIHVSEGGAATKNSSDRLRSDRIGASKALCI